MCPAFPQFLEAPLELSVLEWCVGRSATVPEFQGQAGNNILTAASSVLKTKRNHKEQSKLGKHLRWATITMLQQPKTAAVTMWCDQCTVMVNQPVLVLHHSTCFQQTCSLRGCISFEYNAG